MNKKYRYPGVQAFQKDERNVFFGRDHDKESIFSSILLNRVTVVFGKSGIGKSSLLNAAVIPLLEVYRDNDAEKFEIKRVEAGNYIPKKIYEGLNTSQSSLSNETATKESFDGHGLRSNITKSPGTVSLSNTEDTLVKKIEKKCFPLADDNGHFNFLDEKIRKSLWFQFKKNQQAKTTYIVILDQAEQLFTYPNAEFKEFLEQLAWLTSNYLPDPVRNVIEAQQSNDRSSIPREEYNKLYSPLNIKLVFSIRSDKLHLIPRLNKVIPNILKNTYEVLPLTRLQAELAITEPSKFSGEEFVVEESFTISKQALDKIFIALAEKTTDLDSLDEAYIEPYNLQIICQHIERDIVPNDTDKIIEESELPGDMNDITGKYYYDCIKNLVISSEDERIKIRSFIEDKMIYEEDRRRVTWDKAQITDITADVLNQLVNVRLFEKEMTTESELYKLSHDCLIEPILKAKYERQSDPISQIKKQIDDIKSKTITNEENIKSESFLTSDSTFQRLNPQAINEQTGKNIATRSKDVEKLYDLYKKLGDNYSLVANYNPALEAYSEAIKIAEQNKISPVEAYRARSDVFYYTRNYDLSNKDLEKILELNPDDYQATYNMGLNYKYKGDLDKAKSYLDKSSELNLEFYKKAIETNPKDESSYYQLGEILLERDEYDEAITNFKKALELNPENVNTYNELGRCYYRQKNFQDALTAYEKAIEIDANYYIAIYNIGLVENSLGNEEKALKYFGRAIEITPNYENAYIAMAGIYFNRKDYASARDLYNKLISINPNDEKNFSDLGLIEEYLQNTDAALTNYKKAIEINPYYDLPYYQTGRIFLERSKYDEAIENLKKAIELNPQNANAYNELGRCYYKQKNFEKALSTYKKAIEVNPDYYIAIYNIGLAESELGNKDEALKKFERAIEITPDYENAYIAMAQIYFEKKDYNKAKEMYTKLISINPNDEKIFNDLGLAEENLQNRDAAINNYKKAIEVNPRYDSPYYQMGRIFLSENNYDEAIKNLKKAIELNPLNADAQNELGRCYYRQKNFKEALKAYKKAIEADPAYYIAIYNIGLAESELGNKDEALKKFEKVIEINPLYENTYIAMGRIYFEKKDFHKAKDVYTALVSINPNDEKVFNDLGLAEENLQDWDAAVDNYKKAIEINPHYESPYYQMGRIFLSKNNYEEAIKNFKKAIELIPRNADAYNELGRCYYGQNNFEEALKMYEKALEIDPNYYIAIHNIGLVESELGHKDEAIKNLERVIELNPAYENAYIVIARIYFDRKEYDKAKEIYTKLITINPDENNLNDLGIVEENLQNWDAAIDNYKKAINLNPNYESPYIGLGICYSKKEDYANALNEFKRCIEINPNNRYVQAAIAGCYKRLGKESDYIKQTDIVQQIKPVTYEDEYLQAGIEALCGNVEKAIPLLKAALEKNLRSKEFVLNDPDFDFIRNDPAFITLVGK